MATNNEIIAILGILSASFPRFTASKETAQVYQLLLADIPGDELKAAALQCAIKCDFFPSVHEIRREVIGLKKRVMDIPAPAEAWKNLLGSGGVVFTDEVKQDENGAYIIERRNYPFLPLVEEVALSLGWPSHFGYEMADRAHFMKEYDRKIGEIMDEQTTLPEVNKYIESKKQILLEAENEREQV